MILRLCLVLALVMLANYAAAAESKTSPLIREEKKVFINGAEETWRLEWEKPPLPLCRPEHEMWSTCPCWPFSYGEAGVLDLVRSKNGHEIERLKLAPYFAGWDVIPDSGNVTTAIAGLRKWPVVNDEDLNARHDKHSAEKVYQRQPIEVMDLADYNHDGSGQQFILPLGEESCGHTYAIAIGVTKNNPHLHALGSAQNPMNRLSSTILNGRIYARVKARMLPCNAEIMPATKKSKIHSLLSAAVFRWPPPHIHATKMINGKNCWARNSND